jgi:hypothetical protein
MIDKDKIAQFIATDSASLKRMRDTVEQMRSEHHALTTIIENCEQAVIKYEELHRWFAAQLDEILRMEREPAG